MDGAVVPGENLRTDGIPPIPTALADALRPYAAFREAALASWHPTRREMLILTRFADARQVHRVSRPGGARTQLTFERDPVAAALFPRKCDDYLILMRDRGGNERYQIYRHDLATARAELLTDGVSRNTGGVWSRAGDRIAYQSTRRTGADTDLYVVDPTDAAADRRVAELPGGGWRALDWSPDDRLLLVLDYRSITEGALWTVDPRTGDRRRLTPDAGGKVAYAQAQFSHDGRAVFLTTDRDSEQMYVARLDLATGAMAPVGDRGAWGVEEFQLSPDGATLATITNEDGIGILDLTDALTGRRTRIESVPRGVVTGLQWHPRGRWLGFQVASSRSPSDVYSLDARSGRIDRWTSGETGGLDAGHFVEPDLVRWPSFDGRSISGFLYRPPARFSGSHPSMIVIHGGPEGQFRPGFMRYQNFLLNELGVALLCPNIRGSYGYGKTFLDLDNGYLREDAYRDIESLLDWIAADPRLDATRVAVSGVSYGGHVTLAVTVRCADRIRCAIDVVGPSNLVTLLEQTESYRRDLRRAEYGDERDPEMRAFLDRIAPLRAADRIKRPLFVIQGRNDPRVPIGESDRMVNAVRRAGTPVWYLVADDEGHGFAKKSNLDFQYAAMARFIERFLLGPD